MNLFRHRVSLASHFDLDDLNGTVNFDCLRILQTEAGYIRGVQELAVDVVLENRYIY